MFNLFTLIHGRKRVVENPRTKIGQIVPEQTIADKFERIKTEKLTNLIEEKYMLYMPPPPLRKIIELFQSDDTLTT